MVDYDVAPHLDRYVEDLRTGGAIRSKEVEDAFRKVERHKLVEYFYVPDGEGWSEDRRVTPDQPAVEPRELRTIYSDTSLVIRLHGGVPSSSASEPSLVASMLELLELQPGMRVLEIGAGTGYNAALISEIVGDQPLVVTVDHLEDVVQQTRRLLAAAGYGEIRVLHRDGFYGAQQYAPYDRIVATVGCSDISPAWLAQVREEGFLLVPLLHAGLNPLVRISRDGDGARGRIVGMSGFMAIEGELGTGEHGRVPDARASGVVQERPVWEDLWVDDAADEWWLSPFFGFWFFLGLRDPRVRIADGISLEDSERGRVTITAETISLAGHASLLEELEALHEEWVRLGRPDMRAYAVRFEPVAAASDEAAAPSWSISGSLYHRRYWLQRDG